MPETERAQVAAGVLVGRGDVVVVETSRGVLPGRVLEDITKTWRVKSQDELPAVTVLRTQTPEDRETFQQIEQAALAEFMPWVLRIRGWGLDLELVDLEQTLDREKWILYVLSGRGPDCTKLALQAAAAGFGIIEVQPVQATGTRTPEEKSGCGTGGGGCGCG